MAPSGRAGAPATGATVRTWVAWGILAYKLDALATRGRLTASRRSGEHPRHPETRDGRALHPRRGRSQYNPFSGT